LDSKYDAPSNDIYEIKLENEKVMRGHAKIEEPVVLMDVDVVALEEEYHTREVGGTPITPVDVDLDLND